MSTCTSPRCLSARPNPASPGAPSHARRKQGSRGPVARHTRLAAPDSTRGVDSPAGCRVCLRNPPLPFGPSTWVPEPGANTYYRRPCPERARQQSAMADWEEQIAEVQVLPRAPAQPQCIGPSTGAEFGAGLIGRATLQCTGDREGPRDQDGPLGTQDRGALDRPCKRLRRECTMHSWGLRRRACKGICARKHGCGPEPVRREAMLEMLGQLHKRLVQGSPGRGMSRPAGWTAHAWRGPN